MNEPSSSPLGMPKQQRDELKLQMPVAGKEARDQFADREKKWAKLEPRTEPLSGAVKEASSVAGEQTEKVTAAAMDVAAREISSDSETLRKRLD